MTDSQKIWLWKNGENEYLAFDNPFPTYDGGDPMTSGEPIGFAIFKASTNGRPSISDAEALAIARRARPSVDEHWCLEAAWENYQERLGNRTISEEASIRCAFMAGWMQRSKFNG